MAVIVLLMSDSVVLQEWSFYYTPSVCLAILSVTANGLLAYGLVGALDIIFWRRLMVGGTVSELHATSALLTRKDGGT